MSPLRSVETLVVGAGVSGLIYAYRRVRDDAETDLLVLDGAERVGGLVETVTVEDPPGFRYEAGPESISDPEGLVMQVMDELGLEWVSANSTARALVKDGALCRLPGHPLGLLTSPLLSLRGRLRLLTEPLRRKGVALDGSIGALVRHRMGDEVLEAMVEPMLAGIHAAHPDRLSLAACFPRVHDSLLEHGSVFKTLRARERERRTAGTPSLRFPWKPRGGMAELPRALADALGVRVQLDSPVHSVRPRGSGWVARIDAGEIAAKRVVFALPLRATEGLLEDVDPEAARALGEQPAEGLVVVAHAYPRSEVEHPLDGFGYLVPGREGLRHLGTLFSSTLDPECAPEGMVLLRTLLGGERDPEALTLDESELQALVTAETSPLLGIRGKPVLQRVHRYPAALPRFDLEHATRRERLESLLPPEITVLGNHQHGIGLSALVRESSRFAAMHRRVRPTPDTQVAEAP